MNDLSIWGLLFNSIPEEMLIVLTTMALAGYKDLLHFERKSNAFKLILSTSLMVLILVIIRLSFVSIAGSSIIAIPLFLIVILLVYRYRPINSILGFIFAISVLLLSDTLFTGIFLNIGNVTIDVILNNEFLKILIALPKLLSQTFVVLFILSRKNAFFGLNKLTIKKWIQLLFFFLIIIHSIFSIEHAFHNIHQSFYSTVSFIVNIIIMLFFLSWLVINTIKIEKRTIFKNKIHTFELERLKKMLQNGQIDHAIDLIDLTLKQRR